MSADSLSIVIWYVYLLFIGWCSFPLAFTLFRLFPDRGYSFSKALGLFLTTYGIWFTSSIGLTQYQRYSLGILLGCYVIVNSVLFIRQWKPCLSFLTSHIRLIFFIEGVFLAFLLLCVFIRMYNPDITGAEKEADFTLLNAILHSTSFPPKDTWFTGGYINYYYFGYAIWATVIKATGIISPVGFNLALATIVALAAVNIFGLVYRLTQRWSYSLFSACLLMVLGNIDGFIQILQRQGALFPFDWWRSSRVIPDTINEFPYFSFLLGDLHAHFMSIPFLLLLFGVLRQCVGSFHRKNSPVYIGVLGVCLSLLLGGIRVINGWDAPMSLLLTGGGIVLALRNPLWSHISVKRRILIGGGSFILLGILSRLLFLPFYLHFSPQLTFRNLRLVPSLQRSDLYEFLIIYGFFFWGVLPFLADKFRELFPPEGRLSRNVVLVWLNGVLLCLALFYVCASERVFLLCAVLCALFLYTCYRRSSQSANIAFSFLLLFMAFAILAGCEIVYIKDFYSHPLERQNTIFKFYYQAWILLSVGIPFLVYYSTHRHRRIHNILPSCWKAGWVLLCCACCVYPVLATYEKTNHFCGHKQGGLLYLPTLNGVSHIAYQHPYEYEALAWIQKHLSSNAVILEATGKPYSFFGRVATTTGRSTVLGWGNHEALWRDPTWQSITQRTNDIKEIYESPDKTDVMELLEKYQINYIYVGKLEGETYDRQGLEAFTGSFPLAYENDKVRIYVTPLQKFQS